MALLHHLITIGLTGEPAPFTTLSGEPTNKNVYCPSLAQSAARSVSQSISLKITPRLRNNAAWSGMNVPVSGCTVCSEATVSLPSEGISISWNHLTSSGLYDNPGSLIDLLGKNASGPS